MQAILTLLRRVRAPALVACALAAAQAFAAPAAAGRWEGVADVPGNPLRLVVDLDPGADGHWDGSVPFAVVGPELLADLGKPASAVRAVANY